MLITHKKINKYILKIVKKEDFYFLLFQGDKIKYSSPNLKAVEYEFNNFNV